MGRKSNTIYKDLQQIKQVYEDLAERAVQEHKSIEDYSIKEILEESKIVKDMFHESGTIVSDLFLEDKEDLFDSELEDWNELHTEYKDLCKFIDKWSRKEKEAFKQAENDNIADKKQLLNSLKVGTKINIDRYGIVEFIECKRTRFLAIYKEERWNFPINNFIEVIK